MFRQLASSPADTRNGKNFALPISPASSGGTPSASRPFALLRSARLGISLRASGANPPAPEPRSAVFRRDRSLRLAATVTTMKVAHASSPDVSKLRSQFRDAPRQLSSESE